MSTTDLDYKERAFGVVCAEAARWLTTVEKWQPVVGKGEKQVADFQFEGNYSIGGESEFFKKAGFQGKSCSNQSEAKQCVDAFFRAWKQAPNEEQTALIFNEIKAGHTRLSAHTRPLARTSEKWQETCATCGGAKGQTCYSCSGRTKVTCSGCQGRGQNSCSSCGGTGGRVYIDNYNRRHEQRCAGCSGSGRTMCYSGCHGSGKVNCGRCGATGWLPCGPCDATGIFTHILEGRVTLTCQTDTFQLSNEAQEQRFKDLVGEIWSRGASGQIPDFTPDKELIWNDDLFIEEQPPGKYKSTFGGKLPVYFVDMKPDPRFDGPETTTIFCGRSVSPISLSYLFDTTTYQLIKESTESAHADVEEIKAWTASKLCEDVYQHLETEADEPSVVSLKGISSNVVGVIKQGYAELEEKFTKPGKTMDVRALIGKTFKFTAIGYCLLVALGMFVLAQSSENGAMYAINWDVVGLGEMLRAFINYQPQVIQFVLVSQYSGKLTGYFGLLVLCTLVLVVLARGPLSSPKKWDFSIWITVIAACAAVSWAIVFQIFQLVFHEYYVFAEESSANFLSMLFSELIGVVVMIPDLLAICMLLAYVRIRRAQDIQVRDTLNELKAGTLKSRLGFR